MFADMGQFISAMFDHWFFTWGGIVLVVIAMWEKYRDKPVPKTLFTWLAVVCLVVSMFLSWRDERRQGEDKQKQLDALTATNFKPEIEAVWLTMNAVQNEKRPGTYALCKMHIQNYGAPSAIDVLEAWLILPNRPPIKTEFPLPPTNKSIDITQADGSKVTFFGDYYLGIHSTTPIPNRGALSGWFMLFVPSMQPDEVNRGTINVKITDYSGKQYIASTNLGGTGTSVFQIGQ